MFAAAAAAAALLALPAAASASPELRVEGRHFKDAAGRTVILRGVNVAGNSKVPPFTPASDPAIFDPLEAFGMNVVRLLFTWEAYEPSPGAYDEAYLAYYTSAARAAWARGLFVIVDFHQDAFSRFSIGGCGDGFPAWALPPSVTPADPDNGPSCSDWGFRMLSDEAMAASWDAFYADETGARTRYIAMLKSVAAHLAGEPGVVGYDIVNEPWGDEVTQIGPLYEDAAVAIREASASAILFVEPRALVSAGNATKLQKPSFGNVAYAPHFYDGSVLLFKSWSGIRPDEPFELMRGAAESFGAPLFLGEFGAPAEAGGALSYMTAMYEKLDEGLSSGAQWVYTPGWTPEAKDGWNDEDLSIVDDTGATRDNFEPRPYARRIAGTPTRMRVTNEAMSADNSLELEWDHDPKTGETEIFVLVGAFFGGATPVIDVIGQGLSCSLSAPLVRCSADSPGPMRVRVRATRAKDASACGLTGIELLLLLPLGAAAARKRRGA
jgi:endoglycosylceramidase